MNDYDVPDWAEPSITNPDLFDEGAFVPLPKKTKYEGPTCVWLLAANDIWETECEWSCWLDASGRDKRPWDFTYCPHCGNRIEVAA
jgi:hypothetical protein